MSLSPKGQSLPSLIIALQIGQRSQLNQPEKHQASPICCKVGQKNNPGRTFQDCISQKLYTQSCTYTNIQQHLPNPPLFVCMQGKLTQEWVSHIDLHLKTCFQSIPLNIVWTCTASLTHYSRWGVAGDPRPSSTKDFHHSSVRAAGLQHPSPQDLWDQPGWQSPACQPVCPDILCHSPAELSLQEAAGQVY